MKSIVVGVLICLSISGCARRAIAPAPYLAPTPTTFHTMLTEPFDEERANAMMAPGQNEIMGSALIRQSGGGVVTCAGAPVHLIPATLRAREMAFKVYGSNAGGILEVNGQNLGVQDEDPVFRVTRTTTCNAQGFFSFPNLADGEYFVFTRIVWTVGHNRHGGTLMRKAGVTNGKKIEIVLSP